MRISDWSSDLCSSDLPAQRQPLLARVQNQFRRAAPQLHHAAAHRGGEATHARARGSSQPDRPRLRLCRSVALLPELPACGRRSEEHTSELQSLMRISYAVFCLKKKNKYLYNIRNKKN